MYWRWRRQNPLGLLIGLLGLLLVVAFMPWWFWFGLSGFVLIAIGWLINRGF